MSTFASPIPNQNFHESAPEEIPPTWPKCPQRRALDKHRRASDIGHAFENPQQRRKPRRWGRAQGAACSAQPPHNGGQQALSAQPNYPPPGGMGAPRGRIQDPVMPLPSSLPQSPYSFSPLEDGDHREEHGGCPFGTFLAFFLKKEAFFYTNLCALSLPNRRKRFRRLMVPRMVGSAPRVVPLSSASKHLKGH